LPSTKHIEKCEKSNNNGPHVDRCPLCDFFLQALLLTGYLLSAFGALGVTAGAHRLWAHRTYKAKLPLRILLAIGQTLALQNDIYEWVRDHRVHHKFTDTDADPHNSNRGFFFSHMGWLLVKKHKDVFTKGKTVDMSDVESDPVVRFQRK
jgi:stearoyl-CoA desaturase (delta-9 desaturase)